MKKNAFTLAELLTAVLVISVIMVALAPVITKRMKESISVQTDNKKGLEIYTNPGTYTFDVPIGINTLFLQGSGGGGAGAGSTYVEKQKTFTSSSTWTIPTGVNEITITITGSGGGGGGGNGTNNTNTKTNSCNSDDNFLIRFSSDERDLCITKNNLTILSQPADGSKPLGTSSGYTMLEPGQACTQRCCWKNNGVRKCSTPTQNACNSDVGNSKATGDTRPICMFQAASDICRTWYSNKETAKENQYRLPNLAEVNKFAKMSKKYGVEVYGYNMLNACTYNYRAYPGAQYEDYQILDIAHCHASTNCTGAERGSYCAPFRMWSSTAVDFFHLERANNIIALSLDEDVAASVRCVKSVSKYNNYSGAGGASGAIMEKTINVLPKDVFEITIGSGGNGGAARTKGC